jgi:hypothetical protein
MAHPQAQHAIKWRQSMIVISDLNIIDIESFKFMEFNNDLHRYTMHENTLVVINKKFHTIIDQKNDRTIVKIIKRIYDIGIFTLDVRRPEWIRKYPYIKITGNGFIFKTVKYSG